MSRVCSKCHAVAKEDAKPGDPCWRCSAPSEDEALQLDDQWAAEKAAKQATATMADDPAGRRRRRTRLVASLVSLVIVAAGVVGVVLFLKAKDRNEQRVPDHPHVLEGGSNTVSIEIRARPPMDVRIDQNKAGSTPLTIHVPKKGQLLMIEARAPGHDPQFKQVAADHDQTVDFTE